MEKEIEFSIIVPVYNVADYINMCVDSVLEQTYKEYEILLIDDGSTDGSSGICDTYGEVDGRVKVIHQRNCGSSAARNRGIDMAKGKYILFLDSDDYWSDANVLSNIDARLRVSHADVLSFNYVKVFDERSEGPYFRKVSSMPMETSQEKAVDYQVENDLWIACAWNKAVKRELFLDGELRFKEGVTSEDIDWCFRLACQAESFDYIADVVVCYRQRRTSISRSITASKIDTLLDNINSCLMWLENLHDQRKVEMLKPYIGYQYGTAVYLTGTICEKKEQDRLLERLYSQEHILSWTKNRKVRILQAINQIGGLCLVMILLKLRSKIRG